MLQLFSNFTNGASNELFLGYNKWFNRRDPLSAFPQIHDQHGGAAVNGNAAILAGADQFSQGNQLDTKTCELTENFTFRRWATTRITVGTRNEYVWLRNLFTQSSFGVWIFRNLDSLAAGNAELVPQGDHPVRRRQRLLHRRCRTPSTRRISGTPTPRLAVTAGMRFDVSSSLDDIPYNAAIDSAYGRTHRRHPEALAPVLAAPRLQLGRHRRSAQSAARRRRSLRRHAAVRLARERLRQLGQRHHLPELQHQRQHGAGAGVPGRSDADHHLPRTAQGTKPIGDVNLLAKDLKFPQPLRMSLAYDRQLPWNLVGTVEGLYSNTLNQLFFVNLNVGAAARASSSTGRTVYAQRVNAANGRDTLHSAGGRRGERRHGALLHRDRSAEPEQGLRVQPHRAAPEAYANNWEALVAYTYSRARDVQSFTSSTALSNCAVRPHARRAARMMPTTGISLFDQPHKLIAHAHAARSTGGRTSAPTSRWSTRASRARRTTTSTDRAAARRAI